MSGIAGDLFTIDEAGSSKDVFALEFTFRIRSGPGATRITGRSGNGFAVQVAAPPSSQRTNDECVALLEAVLGVKPGGVELVRGGTGKVKVLGVKMTDLDSVRRSVDAALEEAATLNSAPGTRRTR